VTGCGADESLPFSIGKRDWCNFLATTLLVLPELLAFGYACTYTYFDINENFGLYWYTLLILLFHSTVFFFQKMPFVLFCLPMINALGPDEDYISGKQMEESMFNRKMKGTKSNIEEFMDLIGRQFNSTGEFATIIQRRAAIYAHGLKELSPDRFKTVDDEPFPLEPYQGCPICQADFHDFDDVSVLACNKKHIMHTDCLDLWYKHFSATLVECPQCNKTIQYEDVIIRKLIPVDGNTL